GSASIQLVDGRMKAVDPGAGRLLGLLSLSHIGRRLTLDFGDVTGEGMSFDSIKGDFQLRDGVAHTDNLTLRGSVADIGIAGDTNLRERSYDQTAVVTGDLGASLGVAGTLAGGPAVGAALLLFSQIFKEPLKGVARGYYRITGPWQEPEVRKVDAEDMEAAARRSAGGSSGE
ncbi:MAG: AsmA-like C-terminal region-containing protein, partial [Steroidobacteraceae bacterium]